MIQDKRIAKRNRLVKRLAVYLCKRFIGKIAVKIIKIKVSEDNNTCIACMRDFSNITIYINISEIYNFCRGGHLSEYYQGRNDLLNKYKYKKIFLRLAILHELHHSKKYLSKKLPKRTNNFSELQADRFAIDRVKQLQGIK